MKVFSNPAYKSAFEKFRKLPESIFDKYFAVLQPPNIETGQALEVGIGPGIQTEMLLSRLPQKWKIVAIEPSPELCLSAQTRLNKYNTRLSFVQCRFEEHFMPRSYDVAWMSEVVHLLGDVSSWTNHLASIMCLGGRVLIRTSTHSQLRERYWYKFFPSALEIDLNRHPTKNSILNNLVQAGFTNVSAITIDESRWIPSKLFITMMHKRAFSTLHYISETEFESGTKLLYSVLDGKPQAWWHYEMTAYIATFLGGKKNL